MDKIVMAARAIRQIKEIGIGRRDAGIEGGNQEGRDCDCAAKQRFEVIAWGIVDVFGARHEFVHPFTSKLDKKQMLWKKDEATMNRKWMVYGAATLLLLAGCKKSGNDANQTAANTPGANAANAGNARTAMQQPPQPFRVAEGTSIPVILTSTLSSRVNKPGEEFEASVAEPIMVNGEEAIPKGATVRGTIVDAKKQGTFKGEADLAVTLTSMRVRGREYDIATSTYGGSEKGKGKRTAEITGGGAALGALIGGLAGGGKGALIGAGVGGGGGLAASGATGGKNVEFPAESRLMFRLTREVTVDR